MLLGSVAVTDVIGAEARILDRGYRPYDGIRGGRANAIRAVAVQGFRGVLGIGRPARAKILPVVSAVIAFVPAVVFVGLAVLLPDGVLDPHEIADYSGYYAFIISALALFTALVAPEVLTGDRRTGMIGLYLSTPLTRSTYLIAKLTAVAMTLAIVTVGPLLLLLIGYTFENAGPDGFLEWLKVLARIIVSGAAVSAVYASVSMAFSSLTDRRSLASAGVIAALVVSAAVTSSLVEAADMSESVYLLNLLVAPFELVTRIYGEDNGAISSVGTTLVVAANLGWIAAGLGLTWWRYQRIEVT